MALLLACSDAVDDLLARVPMFAGLSEQDRQALNDHLERQNVTRGDVLFREGETGDRVFVILAGKVKIGRAASDGRENLLMVMGPGDLFGELSLFDPGPRTASATAVTDASLVSLEHTALRPWLATRPEAASLLLRVLAQRLRRTNDSMADMVFTDVPGRVAKALLDLAERFGEPAQPGNEAAGVRVEHGLTQEELAQLVGASRETVNKALADFATRGWLRLDSRAVVLLDRERLARRAR
ncbi:transcriptional regulator, Crp/Fnr family [Candidatus Protofrankia datiscae]|uniref:CRP-like cAMP-activated global transcriptional regulator n=1 Tax=Candidatus Protofrankia datiscae TaxID=2716812 RepID=F8AYK5_9ACTN|nr:transcriptional regulator, Crp/Fnr family [Candidatus Protofrankia datiscae]